MNTTTIENSLKHLNSLVLDGKLMEAFETYYHEDVEMQENDFAPTISKAKNRERELDFLKNITEFRKAEVKGIVVAGNISTVIWHYDYTHKEWGIKSYTQVSVQFWNDGLIIKEQFIYPN